MKISKQLSDIDVRLIKLYQPSAKTFTQEQAGFQGFKHLVDK